MTALESALDTLARPGQDAAERVRRAARADCPPALLRELARDPNVLVRATVAMNGTSDPAVEAILAADGDERVRALLGSRIARLLAGLAASEHDAATEHVHATLRALAADQAVRVRAAVADELAEADAAPRDVILQLAHDSASQVSDRVIRLSPLLSDADLLAILAQRRSPSAATSIASRDRLSAAVADAIIQDADAPTIRALLANASSCIRESTLDLLVGRAPAHLDWHAPLARRPSLSLQAVRALSEFITADLLRLLATRTDLDPSKLEVVRQRLTAHGEEAEATLAQVRAAKAAGTLDEAALMASALAGNTTLLLAQLAVSNGIPLAKVERVLELRSAKALVSLVWHGGFSMSLAVDIQNLLSQFGPGVAIQPGPDGGFPLTESEMSWQIELMNGTEALAEI